MDFSLSSSLVGNAVSNPDKLALDLQFATDKTLTARKGPTPVFTRGSSATFVDSDKLVKYGPENLSLYSGAIDANIGWNLVNSTSSLSGSAPNGNAAYQVSEQAISADHAVLNTGGLTGLGNATPTISGITYTGSIFLKKVSGSINWIQVSLGAGGFGAAQYANFNIETGTVGNFAGLASGTSPQIVSFGDGWYRCSISVTANATVSNSAGVFAAFINNTNGTTRLPVYLGSPSNSILASMCQLERSSTARTYIPTTTAAVYGPRFDHDPVTGVCKGLLMEESRTNFLVRSQEFNLTWGINNSMTVTPDAVIAPDGTMTADAINFDSNVTSRIIQFAGSSAIHTFSVWLRANSATTCILDGQAVGSVSSPVVVNVTTNWQRFTHLTSNFLSGTGGWNIRIQNNSTGTSGTIYAWGAQLEIGSFPTSYIPTTTGTLARSGDVCTISSTAFSNMWNRFSGTVLIRATEAGNENSRWISTDVGQRTFDIIGKTNLKFFEGGGGTTTTIVNVITLPATVGLAYAVNDYQSAYNGLLGGSDTNTGATFPNPTFLDIGRLNTLQQLCGCISFIRYYKKRLPNSKLQAITV